MLYVLIQAESGLINCEQVKAGHVIALTVEWYGIDFDDHSHAQSSGYTVL